MVDSPVAGVVRKVDLLKRKFAERDARQAEVRAVRHGDFDKVAPNLFSDDWPRSIVANKIDVFAKHAAAALSPLPIFSCQSITSTSDRARDFADKRTKIANHYLERSDAQSAMQTGADQFYTYGMIATSVEPDVEARMPVILMEDTTGIYPVWDRLGRTVEVAHCFKRHVLDLIAEYPDLEGKLRRQVVSFAGHELPDLEVSVTKFTSATRIVMYLDEYQDVVLVDMANPLGRCNMIVTKKPGLDSEIKGTFDDLIWVQLAHHAMQTYTLSAAAQAVEAPIAVPNDVGDVPIGPGAVIRTNDPAAVRRINLDVPPSAFAASEYLAKELEYGAITPEALGGSIDASVVTGKGVQQLMAGYSQQIAMCQETLVGHWRKVVELTFELDEKFWPDETKQIAGRVESTPYRLSYKPSRDIAGDYSVQVQYGGIAGLDPNRGLVFLLQALGGDLVSKDYVRRHLPSDINPQDEENKITIEKLRGSLMEGLSALIQSMPQMVSQGQDPSSIVSMATQALLKVQKGERLEDVLAAIFPPPEPQQPEQQAPAPEGAPAPGGEGFGPEGLPAGLTPGVASRGPGGRPDLSLLFAGTNSGGQPNLQAGVSRMLPAGGGV
jgi:hypothetical protein